MHSNFSRRTLLKTTLLSATCLALPKSAQALVSVDITGGSFTPFPIAIPPFRGSARARQLHQIVVNDLQTTGYFNISAHEGPVAEPNATRYQQTGAQAALIVELIEAGETSLQYSLVDLSTDTLTAQRPEQLSENLTQKAQNPRALAHQLSNIIYERITGLTGYFTSQILYIAETGDKSNRVKRIALMDYDGARNRALPGGTGLVLTPRLAPNSKNYTFVQYDTSGRPIVMLGDLNNNTTRSLFTPKGLTFAPRFTPDSGAILLSEQQGASSNIKLLSLNKNELISLTTGPSIDTAPCPSPDGQSVVFESDRAGTQQIYRMNTDGSEITRLSFGDGRYSTPVYSPDGRKIAFTKMKDGQFSIGIMNQDGSGERTLTRDYHAEGPSFSPNGQVIAYFKERGSISAIHTVDITGQVQHQIITQTSASDPSWSS